MPVIKCQLGLKITIIMGVLLASVVSISQIIAFQSEKKILLQQLENYGQSITKAAAISVVEPLLTNNMTVLESFSQQLLTQKNSIKAIKIWGEDNTVVISKSLIYQSVNLHHYTANILNPEGNKTIAKVRISLSSKKGEALLNHRLWTSSTTWGLVIMLFTGFIYWLLGKMITTPLNQLMVQADRLRSGDMENKLCIDDQNEFHDLCNVLDGMRVNLLQFEQMNNVQKEALEKSNLNLSTALQEANNSAKAKSTFLASMSHELRTPMNGVLGMVNLVLDTDLDSEQESQLIIARHSGESLLELINDILDLTKLESGKLETEKITFDLREILYETIDMLYPKSHEKGVEIFIDYSFDIDVEVCGDPTRIRQIVVNLLGNAIKFTQQGEIVIKVHPCSIDTIEISVRDSGIGIKQESIAKIFESFSQAESSTTRNFGGTGLGLALCKRMVKLLHGEIGVHSVPGKGSTFWIRIPVQHKTVRKPPALLDKKEFLLLSTNATHKTLLSSSLKFYGATVVTVSSFDEINELYSEPQNFNTIIIDEFKAEADIKFLMKNYEFSHNGPRIVFLYSYGATQQFDVADLNVSHLVKPVHQDRLIELLTKNQISNVKSVIAVPSNQKQLLAGKQVLIVEDNMVNQIVIEKHLEKMGAITYISDNGQKAVDLFEQGESFDFIFMDCQMPVMDGFEATSLIRQLDIEQPHIIALTANALQGDRERCLLAGMDNYLSKPFKAEDLVSVIMSFTQNKSKQLVDFLDQEGLTLYVDDNRISQLKEQNGSGIHDLLFGVKSKIESLMQSIEQQIKQEDVFMVQRDLQALRGVSLMFGFTRFNQEVITVESLLKSRGLRYLDSNRLNVLQVIYLESLKQLEEILNFVTSPQSKKA